jgi:hypothetical protein
MKVLVCNALDPQWIPCYLITWPEFGNETPESVKENVKKWIKNNPNWAYNPFVDDLGEYHGEDDDLGVYEFSDRAECDTAIRKDSIYCKVVIS